MEKIVATNGFQYYNLLILFFATSKGYLLTSINNSLSKTLSSLLKSRIRAVTSPISVTD
jgi:hypothetical protein